MNRNTTILLLLVLGLAVAFVGCDSDGDDTPADERIVGTWAAADVGVRVATPLGTVPVPVYEVGDDGTILFDFGSDATFAFTVEGPLEVDVPSFDTFVIVPDGASQSTGGTYAISDDEGEIDFVATEADGQSIPPSSSSVPFEFRGENAFVLTIDNSDEGRAVLAFLLGDTVPGEVLDAIEGGEARFERTDSGS